MKNSIFFSLFVLLMPLYSWAQIGGDYNPLSPSDPNIVAQKYTLTMKATPSEGGSFNINNERLAVGSNNSLIAYTNTDFVFKHWMIGDSVLSTNPNMDFVMPSHNVQMVGVFEYNPTSPPNPNQNHWDKQTGEVIVDDFSPGYLSSAISSVIFGSNSNDVQMITVAGRISSNDFGIANNYKNCSLLDLSRVTGVTEVPSYAFDYTNLETVYLPATIEKIGARAFAECSNLSSLTIYAMTPPTLESNVFQGVSEGLVIYVPAAAIAQYQDGEVWGKFILLPIQEDIRNITISLPEGTNASDYAQMWLELTNTKSGQRMHYVMTNRQAYTFANIIRNTSWNVTLRNERGDIFGQIDNVEVKDEDVSVAFTSLQKPQTVSLTLLTPDGQDVTNKTQVTWMDSQGNYLAQGISLTGLPVGYQTTCRIALSQELAMVYNMPQSVDYVLTDGNNNITYQLKTIPQVKISGKVKDASTGLPLSKVVISASQTYAGKYSKTLNTKTDGNGVFTLDVADVPTSVAFAASDYVSQTINCDSLLAGTESVNFPDVLLKNITGATITVNFTYTTCDGETQNWYSDYQNVNYELFNVTKNKSVSQYNVQYPHIVLLEEVADGDVLRLTATSRTNSFMPMTATATIAEQKAETTFAVLELGKIRSTFTSTGNTTVVGSLYNSLGKLVKTGNYLNATLTFNALADGYYTLVSMGNSHLFNTIYDLSQLPQTGLSEGTDYVQNSVEVKGGMVSTICINQVPTLDESKLYYTGDNTSFTVNKQSIVAGNYLTLTGRIDFKPEYARNVSNVQMIVDIPESCEFVENSVMVGNSTSSYTLNGNRITIPMTRYTDRVRFCVIPTTGGEYAPSAFVQFELNSKIVSQPIGDANYTVQDLFISAPSTIAKTSFHISGTAIGQSAIEIYDDGILIGNTTSLANGTWETTCELNDPYNLSMHNICAKVTTKTGLELISETKQVMYDVNMIVPEKVTMLYYNPEYVGQYNIVFDLINKTVSPKSYYFFPYKSYPNWQGSGTEPKDITFIADLSNNDTTIISGVTIRVYTDKGNWRNLEAKYDTSIDKWIAISSFEYFELPIGVDVIFDAFTDTYMDANVIEKGFDGANDFQKAMIYSMSETEELSSQILEGLNLGNITEEEKDALIEELLTTIGFKENVSPNNIPIQNLLVQSEEILNSDFSGLFTVDPHDYKELSKYLDGFTIEKREDLNEKKLINEGFQSIKCTDGKEYYYKISEDEYIVAYLPMSMYIVYDINVLDNMVLSTPHTLRANGVNDVNDFSSWQGKVNLLCENLQYSVSSVASLVDNVIDQVDALAEKCAVQISENLGRLLEDAENPFLSQKEIDDLTKANVKLSKQLKQCKTISSWLAKNLKNFRISDGAGVAFSLYDIYTITNNIKDEGNQIIDLYFSVPDCPKDTNDDDLRRKIYNWGIGCFAFYAGKIAADIIQINSVVAGVSGAIPTGGTSLSAVGIAVAIWAGNIVAEQAYSWQFKKNKERFENEASKIKCKDDDCPRCGKYPCECEDKCSICGNKPCTCDTYCPICGKYPCECNKKCPKCGKNPCECKPPYPQINPIHDPSGYVYEAVSSNRVEGVTASCYYKETVEDMYGDLHENVVLWNAEEYAQKNPLFTDVNGMYRWDVPQGLWQVKFEKEGYETTYSEWLPVPPPQLDVNIAMKQNRQPEVKAARAYEDAVEVEFDKYMMPELLTTENIMVMQDGTAVEGTVELLNEEVSYEGKAETFASKIRFNATKPFTEQEITLIVKNRVKSYAGIRMHDNYQQTFTIEQEIKQIVSDSIVTVGYGNTSTIVVSVLPVSASKGRVLTVKSSSPMILSLETDQVIIDDNGKAEIIVGGELLGTSALTFSVEGSDKTVMTMAKVEQIVTTIVSMPQASITSGTIVEKGTAITLTCETKGATIYYTLDGSCPCDNTDARKVYDGTPIIINNDVTIKAMAVVSNMYESEIAEFTYIVDATGIGDITFKDQIQIYPQPVRDKVNITADGNIIKKITISSLNGTIVSSSNKPATKVTLDVGNIPTGVYIIRVSTDYNTYSHKILKVE